MSNSDAAYARAALLMVKGALADATPEHRQQVEEARKGMQTLIDLYGEAGQVALMMLAMELASEP